VLDLNSLQAHLKSKLSEAKPSEVR